MYIYPRVLGRAQVTYAYKSAKNSSQVSCRDSIPEEVGSDTNSDIFALGIRRLCNFLHATVANCEAATRASSLLNSGLLGTVCRLEKLIYLFLKVW